MGLSSDPAKREAQLANLRRGGPPNDGSFRGGAPGPRLRHGGHSERSVGPLVLDDKVNEILASIAEDNPALVDSAGRPFPQFVPALQAAALMALQVEHVRQFLDLHGVTDERDRWRPENELLDRKLKSYVAALDRLGATPTSLARLGLDVARTEREAQDLARRWMDGGDGDGGAGDGVEGGVVVPEAGGPGEGGR